MGELQVFSLVADPTWHCLVWAPTCFSCRVAKLSLFALERMVGFGWKPYAIHVTRSIACFWFGEAVTIWNILYFSPGSILDFNRDFKVTACSIQLLYLRTYCYSLYHSYLLALMLSSFYAFFQTLYCIIPFDFFHNINQEPYTNMTLIHTIAMITFLNIKNAFLWELTRS